jgi:putative membrane protein
MQKRTLVPILLASAMSLPIGLVVAVDTARPALADEAELSGPDTQFLAKAIISGRNEIELSQVAASKASQAEVKHFAEQMVRDHAAANDKLMKEADRHKIKTTGTYGTPPLEPTEQARMTKQQLEALSGTQFDKAYMQRMIQDHTEAVALFREQAKNGKDKQLDDLAAATLPTLEEHLKQAREIGGRVGVQS